MIAALEAMRPVQRAERITATTLRIAKQLPHAAPDHERGTGDQCDCDDGLGGLLGHAARAPRARFAGKSVAENGWPFAAAAVRI